MDASTSAPPTFHAEASVFEGLSTQDVATLVARASDLAVVLDREGIVRDLAVSEADLPSETFDGWIGRPFAETVTTESRPKIERILSVSRDDPHPFMVQVNHPREGGDDLPIRYSATALGEDRLIAIGRDLSPLAAAQPSASIAACATRRRATGSSSTSRTSRSCSWTPRSASPRRTSPPSGCGPTHPASPAAGSPRPSTLPTATSCRREWPPPA
jgi:hypothetical protein